MKDFLLNNWRDLLNIAAYTIASASVIVASIAKYTKNKTDDKVAGWLKKGYALLSKYFALNAPRELPSADEPE